MGRADTPRLRLHARGQWMARWGGKDHYFGTDLAAAERVFLDPQSDHPGALCHWLAWRASRGRPARRPVSRALTVAELAERMLDRYTADGRPDTARWFAKHLARWLNVHGEARVLDLAVADTARGVFAPPVVPLLNAYLADLGRLDPPLAQRTLKHDVTAIKRLFNFAADEGLCPAVQWRGVRRLRIPRSAPEDLPPAGVRELIDRGAKADPRLEPWLLLNYHALLRPSETVRVVCAAHAGLERAPVRDGQGKGRRRRADAREHRGWFEPLYHMGELVSDRGLFVLPDHKTLKGDGPPRFVVLSPQALAALDRAAPVWSTPGSYSRACKEADIGGLPHVLRDSSASWLHALGAARADVDLLLGHVPRAVSATYIREALGPLWAQASRLTL